MLVLGINAYHADAAACLIRDGQIVAAAEEERFRRVKHWAGFPSEAIQYCLCEAGVKPTDLHHVAINRNPKAHLLKKAIHGLTGRPSFGLVTSRMHNAMRVRSVPDALARTFGIERNRLNAKFHNVEHHLAHLASAFLISPFKAAAIVSIDGFGDFASCMWGIGDGNRMEIKNNVLFPHSLGLFYQAITQFLGFWQYGDEYKVMGLAPYGRPTQMHAMNKIVRLLLDGSYELELDFFRHHAEGIEMIWDGVEPNVGAIFTDAVSDLLGPPRIRDEEITQHHADIAASVQRRYEEAFFNLLNVVQRTTGETAVCIAGGCAMNSVANGKIFERTNFRDLYVQAAAGDAGGAMGSAYIVWNQILGEPRGEVMDHAYLGPSFSNELIAAEIEAQLDECQVAGCTIQLIHDEDELCQTTASLIAEGKVVGWFQGRMEWGPRALGNRSIVCDPRRANMKEILNRKIKRRESFRPFAPSVLRGHAAEWFETDYDVPFMLQVYQVRPQKRAQIPAVTHVDGSGRLQTVARHQNPRYHRLIEAFRERTGVPIVLNTSFNENEPVVCKPAEAIDCFLRTKMDAVVLGDRLITRS